MDGYYVLYLDHDGGEDCVRFAINQLREFCETGLADDHFLYVQSMGYCANTITPGNKIDHFAIHCFDSLMNKYQKVVSFLCSVVLCHDEYCLKLSRVTLTGHW